MKLHLTQRLLPFLLTVFFLFSTSAEASFKKDLWTIWTNTNPVSHQIISHEEWQKFLSAHVITNGEGINLVDYQHISKQDLDALNQYIERLSSLHITEYNRKEQLAYWLNLYNALTIKIIAEHYPINSIQDINISPGLFSIGPWGAVAVSVNHIPLSLDDIHNRIIRPIWNDNRTHYALNNGTIGAPNIKKTPYSGRHLDTQLNQAAEEYINSHRGLQLIEGKILVSKLYRWYDEDFGGGEKGLIRHLKQFSRPGLQNDLAHINHIENYIYNWHLNHVVLNAR